jgi:hypothetical protein
MAQTISIVGSTRVSIADGRQGYDLLCDALNHHHA